MNYVQWQTIVCYNCRINFAVPVEFYNARNQDGVAFFCPAGHSQVFTESDSVRLRRATEALEAERRLRQQAEVRAKNADRHAKAEVTRRKNLESAIAAGVCPKCQRSFKNVRRHMEGKHPEFC